MNATKANKNNNQAVRIGMYAGVDKKLVGYVLRIEGGDLFCDVEGKGRTFKHIGAAELFLVKLEKALDRMINQLRWDMKIASDLRRRFAGHSTFNYLQSIGLRIEKVR